MERLRLLVSLISSIGIKGRNARKVVIAISASKFIISNNDSCKHIKWHYITQSREAFEVGLRELYEITNIELLNSYDVIGFITRVNESEFQRIIAGFNNVDDNVDEIELVKIYRAMATMERDAGEYITNDNVLEIGIRAININENSSIIDSFNGESGIVAAIYSQFRKEGKDFSSLRFYGQEIDKDSYEIGQLIGYLLAKDKFEISLGNSIEEPRYLESNNRLKKFDYAVSVPPFTLRGDTNYVDIYDRFKYFKNKKISYTNSSWLLAEHILATTNESGKAAILLPIGALFRSSINDLTVKKSLVNEDLIECIIKLPSGILNYTGVQTCWIIINKNKEMRRKDKIQFINLSDTVESVGRREKIVPAEYIYKALNCYESMKESDISFIVDKAVIEENEYNLDLFEYVKQQELLKEIDTSSAIKLSDVAVIRRGVQLSKSRLDVLNKEKDRSHFILGLGNIVDGKIVLNEEEKIAAEDRWIDLYEVKEGDILITSKGSLLKTAIVDSSVKNSILSSNLFLIRLDQKKYKPEVLKYFFETEVGQNLLSTIMKGAVIKSISNKDLESLVIPNIDLIEQESISEMIINARKDYEEALRDADDNYENKLKLINSRIRF